MIAPLSIVGTLGGIVGAWLLLATPASVFDKLVPFLVLLATALFMAQEPLARRNRARLARQAALPQTDAAANNPSSSLAQTDGPSASPAAPLTSASSTPSSSPAASADDSSAGSPAVSTADASALQTSGTRTSADAFRRPTLAIGLLAFGIAIYGGYFGAGIGILTLAALGFLGFTNIHQMNGVKNIFTLCINGIAALIFVFKGLVDWRVAALMAVGAIFGGYAGAGVARRIGQQNVRRVIIGLGFVLTLSLLLRALRPAPAAPTAPAAPAAPTAPAASASRP